MSYGDKKRYAYSTHRLHHGKHFTLPRENEKRREWQKSMLLSIHLLFYK